MLTRTVAFLCKFPVPSFVLLSACFSHFSFQIFFFIVLEKLSRSGVQFLLLNAERHFSNVLKEAHSVILLGGTLQPVYIFSFFLSFSTSLSLFLSFSYACLPYSSPFLLLLYLS